jgi:uncharacterized protein
LQSVIDVKILKENPKIRIYLERADKHLEGIGYTEHGLRHATITANVSEKILRTLGYQKDEVRLAGVAGFLHDIGNVCGRINHGQSGAIIVHSILSEIGMPSLEVVGIMEAIGNHEEELGQPTSEISAALILADKSDVHRSRVRTTRFINFDIHDRVNYAAEKSSLQISKDNRTISLLIKINTEISQVMEYFEIFLSRMIICRKAAKVLSCEFELVINENKLL